MMSTGGDEDDDDEIVAQEYEDLMHGANGLSNEEFNRARRRGGGSRAREKASDLGAPPEASATSARAPPTPT